VPRLVKGAKWAYGLVVVGLERELVIPADAWREFQFRAGGEALFVPGSRRSGGFAISTPALMAQVSARLEGGALPVLARGRFQDGRIVLPPAVDAAPGDTLLAVRGSRYGLGWVARGPVYQEALRQRDRLPCYGP
jgi:hypothetical protein